MERMFVTLDVSKVSGWLNANMNCRVEMGNICDAGRGAGREAAQSGGGASGVPHGEERTRNMPYMLVTLEVSKLSGWLNADAPYRESKGGHTVQGEVRAGRREGGGR